MPNCSEPSWRTARSITTCGDHGLRPGAISRSSAFSPPSGLDGDLNVQFFWWETPHLVWALGATRPIALRPAVMTDRVLNTDLIWTLLIGAGWQKD